jgi:hypothetical protein
MSVMRIRKLLVEVAAFLGTVTCSRPAVVSILGRLEEKHARMTLKGFFAVSVPCEGETPWRVTVPPAPVPGWPDKRFEVGKVKVIGEASADDVADQPGCHRSLDRRNKAASGRQASVILTGTS